MRPDLGTKGYGLTVVGREEDASAHWSEVGIGGDAVAAPGASPERPGALKRHREFAHIVESGFESFGGVSALSESMRASVGLSESMGAFGGVSALSESMRASVGLSESMGAFGGVSALSESMRASVGLSESMGAFGGVSALSESMRASLEDLSSVVRFTSYGFAENVRRYKASLIDPASQEDVIEEISSCELLPYGVKTQGQRNDLFDPLTPGFADTKALPVLIVLVPLAPALADSGVAAVASILQQYWFAFRILGAVAEVDPAITGLSLVITIAGMMAWLLGRVDRR